MADMALRFVLSNPDVATVIPGMRKETARPGEHREQRRRAAAGGLVGEAERAPLGAVADRLVAVNDC